VWPGTCHRITSTVELAVESGFEPHQLGSASIHSLLHFCSVGLRLHVSLLVKATSSLQLAEVREHDTAQKKGLFNCIRRARALVGVQTKMVLQLISDRSCCPGGGCYSLLRLSFPPSVPSLCVSAMQRHKPSSLLGKLHSFFWPAPVS